RFEYRRHLMFAGTELDLKGAFWEWSNYSHRDDLLERRGPATRPSLTGSSPTPKTIGIVAVAALAASEAGVLPAVAITATRRRTRSAMSDGRRSYLPSNQWYSTVAVCPSMVPVSFRPLWNAVT